MQRRTSAESSADTAFPLEEDTDPAQRSFTESFVPGRQAFDGIPPRGSPGFYQPCRGSSTAFGPGGPSAFPRRFVERLAERRYNHTPDCRRSITRCGPTAACPRWIMASLVLLKTPDGSATGE